MPAHRSLGTLSVLYLLIASYSARVAAQDANCHISLDGLTYDISHLSSVHTVERERNTPPTKMTDTLEFGICTELPVKGDAAAGDQCPAGTAACLTKVNKKESESTPERIVAVIQLAQASQTPDFATLSEPKGIRITRTGSKWPSDDGEQQSLVLDLLCTPGEQHSPEFVSYDGKTAKVQWRHEAACAMKGEPGGDGGGDGGNADGGESVGSGLGWFFLVLVLAFIGYFGLGAYYNYTTYGATGFDLIPHRDFWREVPYMLQDVVSHLCSSFRPRHSSSRGGYIAV